MRLEDITSRLQETEEMSDSQTGILTHLLSTGCLNLQEIYANMTEMMLGGVDTVSIAFPAQIVRWPPVVVCFNFCLTILENILIKVAQNIR